jgi:peptide-methionine (S)-S-oxide reductase
METITLAGGCFWCTEAVFSQIKGIEKVTPGYSGGITKNPTYREVSTGNTGHAESLQIVFDPRKIKLDQIFYIFFKLHDPTTLNRQGADIGTQYRSAIFFQDKNQKIIAEAAKKEAQKEHNETVVTEIVPFKNFYPADPSHKNYYLKHRLSPYCILVIDPKINKLKKNFKKYLKD